MNIITGQYAVSLFPYSTFVSRTAWVCRRHGTGYRSAKDWRRKYAARGFQIVDDRIEGSPVMARETRGWRFVGDTGSWVIQFESKGRTRFAHIPVFADIFRSFLDSIQEARQTINEVPFEVILRRRGPVEEGCYMNVVPRMTVTCVLLRSSYTCSTDVSLVQGDCIHPWKGQRSVSV